MRSDKRSWLVRTAGFLGFWLMLFGLRPANFVVGALAAVGAVSASTDGTLAHRVECFERETLLAELKRNRNHMTNTAKALGLERSHLYKKCQQLGIDLRAIRHTE